MNARSPKGVAAQLMPIILHYSKGELLLHRGQITFPLLYLIEYRCPAVGWGSCGYTLFSLGVVVRRDSPTVLFRV